MDITCQPPADGRTRLNAMRHGSIKIARVLKHSDRLLRIGIRRAMQHNQWTLLNVVEEVTCRRLAADGKLRPHGFDLHYSEIAEFLYSPLGKTMGIVWTDEQTCPDCKGDGEVECSECHHESECDTCDGMGYIGNFGVCANRIETDLGGYPLGIH